MKLQEIFLEIEKTPGVDVVFNIDEYMQSIEITSKEPGSHYWVEITEGDDLDCCLRVRRPWYSNFDDRKRQLPEPVIETQMSAEAVISFVENLTIVK